VPKAKKASPLKSSNQIKELFLDLKGTLVDAVLFLKIHYIKLLSVTVIAGAINIGIWMVSTSKDAAFFRAILLLLGSCAVLWTIQQLSENKRVSIKEAYFSGTSRFLSFFIAYAFQFVAFLPISLAVLSYALLDYFYELSSWQHGGLILVNILVIIGGLLLFSRLVLAPVIAATTNLLPTNAIAKSWRLSQGHIKLIAAHLIVISLLLLILIKITLILLDILPPTDFTFRLVEELFIQFAIIPFVYVYLYFIYRKL
jgi:predicted small integral membrane protein